MERRTFLKWATHGLGVLFGIVLGAPAVAYLIDARNRTARERGFRPVARLSELTPNVPKQVVIRDVRQDAWTVHPNDVVGRVWLVRRDGDQVEAFTTSCPHLGCSINFHDAAKVEDKRFICPCHNGTWDFNGHVIEVAGRTNPAPRGMDTLQVVKEPEPGGKDAVIKVKYQSFYQGRHTKDPKN